MRRHHLKLRIALGVVIVLEITSRLLDLEVARAIFAVPVAILATLVMLYLPRTPLQSGTSRRAGGGRDESARRLTCECARWSRRSASRLILLSVIGRTRDVASRRIRAFRARLLGGRDHRRVEPWTATSA
jgi:hypothetical protein